VSIYTFLTRSSYESWASRKALKRNKKSQSLISLLGVDEELKAAEAQSVKAEIEANRNFIP